MPDISSFGDIISFAYGNIEKTALDKNTKMEKVWQKVITSIKSYDDKEISLGQNLYEHSNIVDVKNGVMLVETDHPGWSQMMQMRSKYILKGLKMYLPEIKIDSLAFRIRGSNAVLHSVNYKEVYNTEIKKEKEKLEKEQNILNKYEKNDENLSTNMEMPAELLEKFNSIKQSMLTKNENK